MKGLSNRKYSVISKLKKDDERIDKLMKESDKNLTPYKAETVGELSVPYC